jgi:hypothetical protein
MLFSANTRIFKGLLLHALCFLLFAVTLAENLVFGEKSLSSTAVVVDEAVLEGKGQERRSDSNATDSNSTSWQSATDLGAGWKSLDWFGYFYDTARPWIFHADLGWVYRASDDTDSIWLYFPRNGLVTENQPDPSYEEWLVGGQEVPSGLVFTGGSPWLDESTGLRRQPREVYEMIYGKEGSWKWTEKTTYPYLYNSRTDSWEYFLRSGNSKLLFKYSTGAWESF